MHVVVAGAGWLGAALARALVAEGHRVTAIRRDAGRAEALRADGISPLALDLASPGAGERLPSDLDAIVACQAASGDGPDPYRDAYVRATGELLSAARRAGRPVALVYTGSTGVFGQRDGSEVDEETPPLPASPSAEVLAEAERLVLGAAGPALRPVVLRLSGLYGPGRTWPIDRVRSGQLALGPGVATWLYLLHRDDAVAAVRAALARGEAGRVYHATDAEPVRRRDLVAWVAGRLGIPVPRQPEGARAP
ncbi:MAG TPA: NAD-dependent epimerase/dehydratase family protein, partial [Anaeromyxobacteraceae bacterium]|nr:NAD-dependent epimerase/dehydratase family protein [Anaeromyxobacteraceae bacterium]